MNYYEILGVTVNSTDEEIKHAYRQIAKNTHPDYFPGDKEKEERFKKANEAYETLGDPQKREEYNRTLSQSRVKAPNMNDGWQSYASSYRTKTSAYVYDNQFEELFKDIMNSNNNLNKKIDELLSAIKEAEKEIKKYGLSYKTRIEYIEKNRDKITEKDITDSYILLEKEKQDFKNREAEYRRLKYEYERAKKLLSIVPQEIEDKIKPYLELTNIKIFSVDDYKRTWTELNNFSSPRIFRLELAIRTIISDLFSRGFEPNQVFDNNIGKRKDITETDVQTLKSFIEVYDSIRKELIKLKMTVSTLLKKLQKDIETITLKDLQIIDRNIKDFILAGKFKERYISSINNYNLDLDFENDREVRKSI